MPAGDAWRGLDDPAAAADALAAEGSQGGIDRRLFLRLMAASAALGGVGGCDRQPPERIVPRVRDERNHEQGRPRRYASALTRGGLALGIVATTREGRPVKIEGNPHHPASLGGTDIFAQAELFTLYDPDRSRSVRRGGELSTWGRCGDELTSVLERLRRRGGAGLRIVTGAVSSPTFLAHLGRLLDRLPHARWHVHEPAAMGLNPEAAQLAWGEDLEVNYDFAQADVICSLDADFLFSMPGDVRAARDFADRRRRGLQASPASMNRLYVAEPTPSLTGAKADHRLAATPAQLGGLVVALARELGIDAPPRGAIELGEEHAAWARACAGDLRAAAERGLVVPGASLDPALAALALAMNERLGAWGRGAWAIEPPCRPRGWRAEGLAPLVRAMEGGDVELLVVLGCNPAHTSPGDVSFEQSLAHVRHSVHLGLYEDETARACGWHVPMAHELERWDDCRAFDGTASLIQPMIRPLHGGRSPLELVALLGGDRLADPREMLLDHWRESAPSEGLDRWWHEMLQRGTVEASAFPRAAPPVRPDRVLEALDASSRYREARAKRERAQPIHTLTFVPDPTIWDGRWFPNAWLQELPKPLSKLTWDNALLVHPQDATALRLDAGDTVRLVTEHGSIETAVWPSPGQARGAATLSLGYGHRHIGPGEGEARGFDAYALRREGSPWVLEVAAVEPLGRRYRLATTQHHGSMEGRDHYRRIALDDFRADPRRAAHPHGDERRFTLLPEDDWQGPQWGMAIDLTACIGCGACTAACQAENNIPVVGKDQVRRGREMHWIRVDRYYLGDAAAPGFAHQPVPCMHCEKAPCEVVCPVGATLHSHDGLNEMTYNRCIGTRYCSNNCPYKVRRFNFLAYSRGSDEPTELARNPDVSLRWRGVMEKCTYCVQRIRRAEAEARIHGRPPRDGEIVTACQQACPARAISFGDVSDPASEVSRWKDQPHGYAMLEHLNTRPRTSYLAEVTNPSDVLASRAGEPGRPSGAEGEP